MLRQEDRLSPLQHETSRLYSGEAVTLSGAVLEFCSQVLRALPQVAVTSEKFSLDEMASTQLQVGFLTFLIELIRAQRVLEIGTFIGATTLALATAVGPLGRVVTLELGEEFANLAQRNFAESGVEARIQLIQGDALDTLKRLPRTELFDFVYLDGAKQLYPRLFELVAPLVRIGGLFVADDVFFHGDALNPSPKTDKGEGTRRLAAVVASSPEWSSCILPLSNGLLLSVRVNPAA